MKEKREAVLPFFSDARQDDIETAEGIHECMKGDKFSRNTALL